MSTRGKHTQESLHQGYELRVGELSPRGKPRYASSPAGVEWTLNPSSPQGQGQATPSTRRPVSVGQQNDTCLGMTRISAKLLKGMSVVFSSSYMTARHGVQV